MVGKLFLWEEEQDQAFLFSQWHLKVFPVLGELQNVGEAGLWSFLVSPFRSPQSLQ